MQLLTNCALGPGSCYLLYQEELPLKQMNSILWRLFLINFKHESNRAAKEISILLTSEDRRQEDVWSNKFRKNRLFSMLMAKADAHSDIIFIKPRRWNIKDSFFSPPELQHKVFKDMFLTKITFSKFYLNSKNRKQQWSPQILHSPSYKYKRQVKPAPWGDMGHQRKRSLSLPTGTSHSWNRGPPSSLI